MNTLDSRDLEERLSELEELEQTLEDAQNELDEFLRDNPEPELDKEDDSEYVKWLDEKDELESKISSAESDFSDTEREELYDLRALCEEVGGEWKYGVQFIPESDFTDYCKELCEEIGAIPSDFPDYIVINWEETADNIRQDYSECTINGESYLYRA